ncbi:pilus assembly protein [uncultured Hydrogenophaga sp.]|uniref:pilus assembly protein n=1 Tax=uncultured Hydrogenophaga sp. TaxID=199683 RepID=UPI00265D6F19|nr:PilC/PilY family type IV pilus protein [uncultured Hydrogenophaga sp.]
MYEAFRYFSGGSLLFANEKDALNRDGPEADALAVRAGGTYASPVGDCQYVYVILMTDGEPTSDTAANTLIEEMTGKTCASYGGTKNCMPELAEYMYNEDLDGVASNGIQRAVTYTIGFATNQALLSTTATRGGGQYYTADNTEELTTAFQGAITNILSTNASFTSPAVAVDSFTRTESRDDVFYAMFRPTTGVNWPGNIKKLKVRVANNGAAALIDSAGNEAIDSQTGFIKESAVTFWGTNADGPQVGAGGVGGRLAARDPDSRVIKTNTGLNGALQDFSTANINRSAYTLNTDSQLHSLFDVGSADEFSDLIAWARGWTDRNKTSRREWILGDIVHSRPLVLNYGARTTDFSSSNPDLRVVVGTNAGFLHMFNAANGDENWAFFPKELTRIFKARKEDLLGGNKVWGVDAPVVSYRFDANQDGSIKATDGDKMYIVFGLRRGGRALYAMDVTDPDNPSFLWRVGADTAGFSELGQTWSVPVVTNVPGYVVGGVRRPVLIFGAGYDAVNDDITRTASETTDTVGRGLFVIDVATGALVWSVTPAANSATNKREAGFVHAMAAPPSVIDSNGDGIADRVYMPDVGGNVWRIDMPGNTRPTAETEQNRWRVTKLASLANIALLNPARQAGDRRFLSEVDVVRSTYRGRAFDAVLLGSGDRTNPKATDNADRFYMLRDYQVSPYITDAPTTLQCSALINPSNDNRCKLPITESALFNATDNKIQVGNATEQNTARNSLAQSMGWFITLGSSLGEKSLSAATTLRGTTFFTTFAPSSASANANICEPSAGTGRLYAVNLQDGSATIDFNGNGALVTADRSALLGSTVPDSPSLYFARDQQIRLLFPAGGGPVAGTRGAGGSNCGPGMLCGPRGLRPVVPTYRYEQEY